VLQQTYEIHTTAGLAPLAPRRLKRILESSVPKMLITLLHETIRPQCLGSCTFFIDYRTIEVPDLDPNMVFKNGVARGPQDDGSFLAEGFPYYPSSFSSLETLWRGVAFSNHTDCVALTPSPAMATVRVVEPVPRIVDEALNDGQAQLPTYQWNIVREYFAYAPLSCYGSSEEARFMFGHACSGLVLHYRQGDELPLAATAAEERANTLWWTASEDVWLGDNILTHRAVPVPWVARNNYIDSLRAHPDFSEIGPNVPIDVMLSRIGFIVADVTFPVVGKDAPSATPVDVDARGGPEKRKKANRIKAKVKAEASSNTYGRSVVERDQPSEKSEGSVLIQPKPPYRKKS